MPRSSRHKSKRSVRDARDYSDTEEDVSKGKHRDENEEGGSSSRGYKESGSGSGEKRKLASSRTVVVKDSSSHGNGYSSEEYVGSKRRKDKSDRVGSDRWHASAEMSGLESETREESSQFDEKVLKSKGLIDLKSKVSGGRLDVEKKEEAVGSFIGKVENRMVKVESKRRADKVRSEKEKLDRDLIRKDDYKDAWEKERASDRDNQFLDSKPDLDYQYLNSGEQKVKKGVESKAWAYEDDYRKHESDKERERRRRKRTDEFDDMDKYQERNRDISDIKAKSRRERDKEGRDRDERDKDIGCRDKHREYYDRDHKGRDGEKREGADRDDRSYRDCTGSKNDSKYARNEAYALDSRLKKSRTDSVNYDGSVIYDDQSSKHNDYKETGRSMDKEDYGGMRSQSGKELLELEKKSSGAHAEEQSRHKRSPSSTAHSMRDQYRYSKQSETKYREPLPEERSHNNLNYVEEENGYRASDRAHSSRAIIKSVQKGDSGFIADLSSERHRNTDRRASPVCLAEKSLSPEHRLHSRTSDRGKPEYDDAGHRNSGYKYANYQFHDVKRSLDAKVGASPMGDASQVNGDNLPVSSSCARSTRIAGSSRSRLPAPSPLKHGTDNSYVGSSEEDGRNMLNNRSKRLVDSSLGRMQGNAWRGVHNWPSPMANGFLPFPHGPPTVGFHPMMQQFPHQVFGVRPSMDHNGVPYHIPDADRFPGYGRPFGWPNHGDETCPSPMQNWDSNNMVLGEGYVQGRLDWDQNRSLVASASREPSVDRYKCSNSGTMESPSNSRRTTGEPVDDFSSQSNHGAKSELFHSNHQINKAGNSNLFGSEVSLDMSASVKEVSDRMSKAKVFAEIKQNFDSDDYVHRTCVYLSKVDVSAYLTRADLFDKCVSLLGKKPNALADPKASRFHLEEESDVVGGSSMINTYISRVPFFSGVSDSLLEKAISLYRQLRDEVVAISLSSASYGNQAHPSHEIQGSDPTPGIERRVSLPSSQSGEASVVKPARHALLSEFPALNNNGEKTAKSVICSKLEAPSPTSHDNLDEDVENSPEVQINPISTSEEVSEGLFSVLDQGRPEITAGKKRTVEISGIDAAEEMKTVEKASAEGVEETTVQSPNSAPTSNAEGMNAFSAPVEDDDGRKEVDDEQAADKTAAGDPTLSSTSNVPFEGCDVMMTDLDEFGSVNLSRIHQSPESTHWDNNSFSF